MQTAEELIQMNYSQERDSLKERNHPFAQHFAENWKDAIRNLHVIYLQKRRTADDWSHRQYSPNSRMVTAFDPVTKTRVIQRADIVNENKRRMHISQALEQAKTISVFTGDLLTRIATTEDTKVLVRQLLADVRKER